MFKTFPEFSKLTLEDKDEYEALIKDFPPIADFSFVGLMTWWNELGYGLASMIDGNLIIPYWLPGDEKNSGLSLVGTNNIDESMCAVFDYLREKGEKPRLVNVPEFVLNNIQYPEMFIFKSERCYDEYLLAVKDHYPAENMKSIWRRKVVRRLPDLQKYKVEVRSLDLGIRQNKDLLLQALTSWQAKNINNYGKLEQLAVERGIRDAERLGIENVCLFVDDELHGFCTYILSPDKKLATVYCVKATHAKALGYELILHLFAKWFAEYHVEYVNLNADYGLLSLRMFMLTFGPMDFNRKYMVEPREDR